MVKGAGRTPLGIGVSLAAIEALITLTNTYVDGIEALSTLINGNVVDIETLLGIRLPATLDAGALRVREQNPLATIIVTQAAAVNLQVEIHQPAVKETFRVEGSYEEDEVLDTSTNVFTLYLAWDVRLINRKSILLRNTGLVNSIDYWIFGQVSVAGLGNDPIAAAVTLAPNTTTAIYTINDFYSTINIFVQSTVGGAHSTFEISYGGDCYGF